MTGYYRALRSEYLTDPRLKPEHALVMNYLVAQAEGFEVNRKHLNAVFAGRIGQDRIKATLKALGEMGYITVQKSERTTGGKFTRKPALVNHSACVYRGQTEGVLTKRSVTERSVATPTTTTTKTTTTNTFDSKKTYGVGATPSAELAGDEESKGSQPSGSRDSSSQGSSPPSSQGSTADGTNAPLRLAAPKSSVAESAVRCPLECGDMIPANASAEWTDGHVQARHSEMWGAWQEAGR